MLPGSPGRFYLALRAALALAGALLTFSISFAGPFGGSVNSILLDKDEVTPLYAATERGLFSFEGGKWVRVPAFGVNNVRSVQRAGKVFVALKSLGDLYVGGGEDKWRPSRTGLEGATGHLVDEMNAITVDASNPKRIYMGSAGKGPFVTPNQGRDWDILWTGLEDRPPAAGQVKAILSPREQRPLIMGTEGDGLFFWKDKSWRPFGEGLPQNLRVMSLAEDPRNPDHLAMGTGDGLWESTDGAKSWKLLRKGEFKHVSVVSIGYDGAILGFFPGEGFVVAREGKAGKIQKDQHRYVLALMPHKGGGWYAGLRDDGIVKIDAEGKDAGFLNEGLLATRIYSIHTGKEPGTFWCGDSNGMFFSRDRGVTWEPRDNGLVVGASNVILEDGGEYFMGSHGLGVYLWDEAAGKWLERILGLGTSNTIYSFVKDPKGRFFVGTEGGILRSDDRAGNWVKKPEGLPAANKWFLAAEPSESGGLWAASSAGLYYTSDGGESWKIVKPGDFGRVKYIEGKLYLSRAAREVIEWDGREGILLFTAPQNDYVNDFVFVGKTLIVATGKGLWDGENEKKPLWGEAGVLMLYETGDGRIYAGTDGMGVKSLRIR